MKLFLVILGGLVGVGLMIVSVLLWGLAIDFPETESQTKLIAGAGFVLGTLLAGVGYAAVRGSRARD